jgi:transcriptional regulator with XRE-family HTH domain
MSLGQEIQKARIDKHWNQQDLLRATGLSQAYLSAVERDKVDPRVSIVKRIARALGVTMDRLVPIDADDWPPSRVGRTPAPAGPPLLARSSRRRVAPATAATEKTPVAPAAALTGPRPLCAHCGTPMAPRPDGQGFACPGCRYSVTGAT